MQHAEMIPINQFIPIIFSLKLIGSRIDIFINEVNEINEIIGHHIINGTIVDSDNNTVIIDMDNGDSYSYSNDDENANIYLKHIYPRYHQSKRRTGGKIRSKIKTKRSKRRRTGGKIRSKNKTRRSKRRNV